MLSMKMTTITSFFLQARFTCAVLDLDFHVYSKRKKRSCFARPPCICPTGYGRARFAAPEAQQNYSSASLPPHQTTGGEEN
jgi:hypothetical protein